MWPFKKEIIKQEPSKSNSLFSTDWNAGMDKKQKRTALETQITKSFQKAVNDFVAINPEGKLAMDEAYNDLTLAKLQNMSFGVLPENILGYFAGQGFIGWQASAMISQNWLINKACTMPAEDASRNGYEITVNDEIEVDPSILEYMRQRDKELKVLPNCVEAIRMGRIFGIRIVIFEVDSPDPDYYAKPFNIDGVRAGAYKGISQIDPYWIAPLLDYEASSNPAAKDFYEPTWWLINGKRYHRTHLVIYRTCDLPDILKPSYIYGGIPVPQWIAERVYAAERMANEAPLLSLTKRLYTLKIDLTQGMAQQEVLASHLTALSQMRDNYGVQTIGLNDEVQQFDTSLADVDVVTMTQFQLVAAAAEIPATKLLGTSPKGFNATGEFDAKSYHQKLTSIQQHGLSPIVERHHLLLNKSEILPKFGVKFKTEVKWNPVDEPTASEAADINLKKAQTDSAYANVGAIDGVDIRNRLISDKESGYNGIEAITEDLTGMQEIESDENSQDTY
jgi:phage-related protein (TIGR01555 family)